MDIHAEKILILDFGSQTTQLIARRVRESQVYCEIHPFNMELDEIKKFGAKGIILSGGPACVLDEGAPTCEVDNSIISVDAMDYYCTWKLIDALTDYAFYGINEGYCLGNTSEQRNMRHWSDGTPVKELVVTDTP